MQLFRELLAMFYYIDSILSASLFNVQVFSNFLRMHCMTEIFYILKDMFSISKFLITTVHRPIQLTEDKVSNESSNASICSNSLKKYS